MFEKLYEIFTLFVNITIACNYFGSAIKYSVLWMKYSQGLEIVQNLYKIFIDLVWIFSRFGIFSEAP